MTKALLLLTLLGCSSPASPSPSEGGVSEGGSLFPDSATMSDGGASDAANGACNAVDLGPAPTIANYESDMTEPTPAGGSLQTGTYYATKLTTYDGQTSGPTANGKLAIVFAASTFEWANDGATGRMKGTWTANGSSLQFDASCPQKQMGTIGYTASGSALQLFLQDNAGNTFVVELTKQ